eukprot:TRINITY_DN3840_c0_g1_i1.p1 TRINITY_DN3840_c0_g1~~TRINITY_DN3840_c0_g1_i1.p1  ORF type:complete len:294 (+),score=59.77 TRINITY_DN3840_c0_g1_i1:3-884(+)
MQVKDRSSEFQNYIQSLNPNKVRRNNKAFRQPSEFARQSGEIGKNLADVWKTVESLLSLLSKDSLFDDRGEEIARLSNVIKQSIETSRRDIEALDVLRKKESYRNKNCQYHAETIVTALNQRLASATKTFGEALAKRSQTTKEQQKRVDDLTGTTALRQRKGGPRPMPAHTSDASNLGAKSSGGTVSIPMPGVSQQSTVQIFADTNRLSAVEKAETMLSEIHKMVGTLASLMVDQQANLDRIDRDLEESVTNVGEAQNWLLKYQRSISGNRGLIIRIFIFLAVFVVLFMLFYR